MRDGLVVGRAGVFSDALFAWDQHADMGRNVNLAGFPGCPSGAGFFEVA